MKLVTAFKPQKIDKSHLYVIAAAQDSSKYYAAIVDPNTHKCFVEEMGLSMAKEELTGYFLQIVDDEEWKTAMDFFEKRHVFSKFLEGRNWILAKRDGKITELASKFQQKVTK